RISPEAPAAGVSHASIFHDRWVPMVAGRKPGSLPSADSGRDDTKRNTCSKKRLPRCLARRERFNACTPAALIHILRQSCSRCAAPLPHPLLGQGEGIGLGLREVTQLTWAERSAIRRSSSARSLGRTSS